MFSAIEELFNWKTSLLFLSIASFLLYSLLIYPICLSPLASIPAAHPSCHFSNVWIKWHRWKGTDLEAVQLAFEKHGPYIRLASKEIGVNSKDGFDSVYGIGSKNLDRPHFYDYFINHGVRNMFTSLTATEHAYRKGRLARVYSKSFVEQSRHVRAIIKTVVWNRFVPEIQQAVQMTDGVLDILSLTLALPLDVMSAFVFGLGESYNTIDDKPLRQTWLDIFSLIFLSNATTLLREFKLLTKCLARVGYDLLPLDYYELRSRGETWATERVNSLEKQFRRFGCNSESFSDGYYPILFGAVRESLVKNAQSKENIALNAEQRREAASECLDHIGAAGDTYGTTFSYIVYQLSRNLEIQSELRRELATVNDVICLNSKLDIGNLELPAPKGLARLPLLNGIIREGCRLRNSPPGMDPRVTPPGRLSTVGPYIDIPPGVRVGAYTYLLQRKEELYHEATEWNPSRWNEKDISGKLPPLFAFSGGSRGCIGQSLSNELMRQNLAAMYANFKTTISDDSAYPGDSGRLSGDWHEEKLWIKFERV